MAWPSLYFLLVCWVVTTAGLVRVAGACCAALMGAPHLMQVADLSLIWALHSLQLMRAMMNSD